MEYIILGFIHLIILATWLYKLLFTDWDALK